MALSTHELNNHAVRDRRYRYIRYADGSEELYDHRVDPHEWKNLAKDPSFTTTREKLRRSIPSSNAPEALSRPASRSSKGRSSKDR